MRAIMVVELPEIYETEDFRELCVTASIQMSSYKYLKVDFEKYYIDYEDVKVIPVSDYQLDKFLEEI